MADQFIVSAGGGAGLRLARGEHVRIIDIEGGQSGVQVQRCRADHAVGLRDPGCGMS